LINDILDLSKIESGLLEMRCENFSVASAMPEVLSIVRPLAMTKKIQIEQSLPDLWIHADRIRFKQILYNLLSNALKFTAEGGNIRVDCVSHSGFDGYLSKPIDMSLLTKELRGFLEQERFVGESPKFLSSSQ